MTTTYDWLRAYYASQEYNEMFTTKQEYMEEQKKMTTDNTNYCLTVDAPQYSVGGRGVYSIVATLYGSIVLDTKFVAKSRDYLLLACAPAIIAAIGDAGLLCDVDLIVNYVGPVSGKDRP